MLNRKSPSNDARSAQLVKGGAIIARVYEDNSPAEQHSIPLVRGCIYTNQEELDSFRALVVNSIIATDICDTELKALRNGHWDRVFCHP